MTDAPKNGWIELGTYSSRFVISVLPSVILMYGSAYITHTHTHTHTRTFIDFAIYWHKLDI